ncbi:hypothetical protein Hypma_004254 [Hypsizygus marmoreus]|uniref:Uncharacterized protein n=1 Tax=Hypsizygus marmoreus TaxID=39966 RepID=A0A369J4B2_HYPMA|nr:hypothetical protein Hypma_004254 [Hypsizygus marmoreus]
MYHAVFSACTVDWEYTQYIIEISSIPSITSTSQPIPSRVYLSSVPFMYTALLHIQLGFNARQLERSIWVRKGSPEGDGTPRDSCCVLHRFSLLRRAKGR